MGAATAVSLFDAHAVAVRAVEPVVSLLSFRVVREPVPAEAREAAERTWTGGADAARFVMPLLAGEPSEVMLAAFLNAKHRLAGAAVVGRGGLDHVPCEPREVFRAALLANAAAVILAHNHPSGDPEPSAQDLVLTERIAECGRLMGIPLLDHLVIGDGRWVTLAERGWTPIP